MEVVTADLSKFGNSELSSAVELLNAYIQSPPDFLGDGLTLNFNTNSGKVFLSDEDLNVGVIEDDKIVQFINCGECGYEGTKKDYNYDKENNNTSECCKEYFEQE